MAKHKKSSGFKAFGLSLPKMSTLKSHVSGMDVLAGAGVGIVGVLGFKYLMNKLTATKEADGITAKEPTIKAESLPKAWPLIAPVLGTALFGALAYALYSKKSKAKATGWLVGSVGAGVALTGLSFVRSMDWARKAGIGDGLVKNADGSNNYSAFENFAALQRDTRLPYGALVSDTRRGLNQLAEMSMGDASAAEELDALLG